MLKDNHVSASVLNSVDGVLEFGKGDTVAYICGVISTGMKQSLTIVK